MSLRVGLRTDYPHLECTHQCSGDTTIAALRDVLAEAGLATADQYHNVRAARLGADVVEVDDLDQTLSELEIQTNSLLVFFAPPELKPDRNLTKKEIEQEEVKAKKSGGGGFGKYAAFNHGNCFVKLGGKNKKESKLALEFIEAEAAKLFDSDKNTLFLKLGSAQLGPILQADRLNINEGKLFGAMQEYATKNKKTSEFMKKEIYTHIRFPTMDVKDIASTVASSNVLDQKQLLSLFTHTALPANSRPSTLAGFTKKQCKPRNPRFIGCTFDKGGSKVTISEDKRTASYSGSSQWQGAVTCTPSVKYSFKIMGNSSNLMAGFTTPGPHKLEGNNYSSSTGYYFYLNSNGSLYGKGGKSGGSYSSQGPGSCGSIGNIITCEWNKDEHNITFYVNGQSKGVAYTGVTEEDLVPAMDFYDSGCSIQLCDNPSY